ncbi:MAG: MBL fold metallo-hydrolase [Granulosicoccus sp.]
MSIEPDKHAGLEFPFGATRGVGGADGQPVQVANSILGIRQALPFALDHVNCWLLGEPGDQVLVDTGVDARSTRESWSEHLSHTISAGSPAKPERVLITHFHPDHMGLAGWFASAGSKLIGTQIETDFSRQLWDIEDRTYADFYASWYQSHGLPQKAVSLVRESANTYKKLVHRPPPLDSWSYVDQGDTIELAGQSYEVLIGKGHAPHMLMLYRPADRVLIAADQVLSSITPNVSVMPRIKDPNPLQSFLNTLESLRRLPEDTLVLPSHGAPFRGLWAKIEALEHHHELRLDEVLQACTDEKSAFDLFGVLFGRELDAQQTSFALGESLAHLHYLEAKGLLARSETNGVVRFVRA